jgi:hypothetical protein
VWMWPVLYVWCICTQTCLIDMPTQKFHLHTYVYQVRFSFLIFLSKSGCNSCSSNAF